MGGSQEWGVAFIIGRWEFLKYLYIVGRGVLSPLFYKDSPLYCLPPPVFKFCPTPSHFPVISNPHSHWFFCCPVSLAEWVIMPHLMCYFTCWWYGSTHVEHWYVSTRRTLMCVYAIKHQVCWRLTQCGFLLVLWFDIKHTNTYSTLKGL